MQDQAISWAKSALPALAGAAVTTLRAEASFRAFYRLQPDAEASVVLMVSPPEREQNKQFERLAEVFGAAGIPVPRTLAADREAGWYLLTDLGSRELADAYGTSAERAGIEAALTTLIDIQAVRDDAIPPYATARFADELQIFSDWFANGLLGRALPAAIGPVFDHLVARMPGQPQCCVHRDYHCRNLLFDPASGQLGVVDFQDALIGPAAYDLASLLHDCYHRFSEADVAHWRDWYLARTPLPLEPETFAEDLTLTAVQRQLKAVGIFARLKLRDGRATHLDHIPPVLESLVALTAPLPALAPLAAWLTELDGSLISARIEALKAEAG